MMPGQRRMILPSIIMRLCARSYNFMHQLSSQRNVIQSVYREHRRDQEVAGSNHIHGVG